MHKYECKSCETAKRMMTEYDEMILDNQDPSLEDMLAYNTVMTFYENLMNDKAWMDYHRDVKGAIYISDLIGKKLTEEQAKEWVQSMYHIAKSGQKMKGEKWNIDVTSRVLEEHGLVFNDACRPIEGYLAMNMAWHDHYNSAVVADMENEPKFYVALAKDCLIDDDAKHTAAERMYIKHYMITM